MSDRKLPSRTTGTSENLSRDGAPLSFGIKRFAHGNGSDNEIAIWRLQIGTYCTDSAVKIDTDATGTLLRKIAAWCQNAALIIERDGLDEKERAAP